MTVYCIYSDSVGCQDHLHGIYETQALAELWLSYHKKYWKYRDTSTWRVVSDIVYNQMPEELGY